MRHQDMIREQYNDNRMMVVASVVMLVIIMVSIGVILLAGGHQETGVMAVQVQYERPAH